MKRNAAVGLFTKPSIMEEKASVADAFFILYPLFPQISAGGIRISAIPASWPKPEVGDLDSQFSGAGPALIGGGR